MQLCNGTVNAHLELLERRPRQMLANAYSATLLDVHHQIFPLSSYKIVLDGQEDQGTSVAGRGG